jgi:hypothetical protein
MLFYKPVDRYWLTNRPSIYAKRWALKRSTYDRENTWPMTKEEYIQGPTPIVSKKATTLLDKIYKRSVDRVAYRAFSTLGAGLSLKVKVMSLEEAREARKRRRYRL